MPYVRRTAALAAALALMATATPAEAAVSRGVVIPAFYDVPASLPAANGAIVRSQPMTIAWWLPGILSSLPAKATRVMYKTTDSTGAPAGVTGAYLEPKTAWSGPGPRPLVVLLPGTQGQGDQCAPSMGLERPITVSGETFTIGYENIAMNKLLSKGVAVMVTDYVGLGATDRLHTYVNRIDQGRAALDAARAARSVPGATVTAQSQVGLYGYSQGGGSTASAAELQPTYAPDVQLAGAAAGAPPANLKETLKGIDGSAIAGAAGWSLNGFVQAYPQLRRYVDTETNAAGKAALKDLSTMCTGDIIFKYPFAKSSSWTVSGKPMSAVIDANPAVGAVLDQQRLGTLRPTAPVRVSTGVVDDIVPHAQARQLAVDWCARGANVTYVPVPGLNLGNKTVLNHVTPMIKDLDPATTWLMDRLAGKPVTDNCGTV
ncbi:triacylglycerol lipase [Yimella sp. cx-573]|nr:triacylglycerol lipase [Yimella sp. cx-573]